ncbi:MAG TPA: zf-HC2 domain-containing protein [Kofleriaceae bacterium]|jgi:anti-sigma factor RsiW|nr:zf-HC2 domain-containing protein [Kofleriaceae bacterium]
MSLCQSIDTLSMAFLDDELATEERRELELHLFDCASCRTHLDAERDELAMLRKALVPPPAPALLKARIGRVLDAEDAATARSDRRRWSQWFLPGSAMLAAAAAILVFVGVGMPGGPETKSAPREAIGIVAKSNSLPLEVQGASTGPWLRRNFAPVEPPQFTEPGIALLGARLLPNGVANHDAAMLSYLVSIGENRLSLTAVVLKNLDGELLNGGQGYRIGDLVLRLHEANGMPVVTYFDPREHVGYVFGSERLTADELLRLVASTDLIARAQQQR